VVVTGAAGAVGSLVGQIAKIKGLRVIGIAGSDDKTDYITKELGFDAAINYKTTPDIAKAIAELAPNGVDIHFDNVGGEISDAVLANLNRYASHVWYAWVSWLAQSLADRRFRLGSPTLLQIRSYRVLWRHQHLQRHVAAGGPARRVGAHHQEHQEARIHRDAVAERGTRVL